MRHAALLVAALLMLFVWSAACSSEGDGGAAQADAAVPLAIPRPETADPMVLRGWESVLQRDCASCHQQPDAGDAVLSGRTEPLPGTNAYPPNLTPDPDTGLDGWPASAIVNALRKGVDIDGVELCTAMPRFADMTDDEAAAIAAYLQFLTAVHHAVPESLCPPIKVPQDDVDAADDGASPEGADGSFDAGAGDAASDASDAADG